MPLYEYVCRKCHKQFSEVLTVLEHDDQMHHDEEHHDEKVQCPKCHSEDLEKVIEPFYAKTASKTHAW
jgi:putative FmdB family regulatory protein